MLEPVFAFLKESYDSVKCWQVVKCYEEGVILRKGLYLRNIGPGFHWKRPLWDEALITETIPESVSLESQSLTTKDGVNILVSGVLLVRKRNVKTTLLEIQGVEEVVAEVGVGILAGLVMANTYDDLRLPAFLKVAEKACHEELTVYGMNVLRFKFQDFVKCRTFRMVQ